MELTPQTAQRFEVVRGVLMGSLRLDQGARRLRMPEETLGRLVEGCRRRVLQTLGEDALDEYQAAEQRA